ncbi:MAG: hypothetical protein JRI34_13650 [Deltaproteobacteria bacterium]|nr:hypothetical protein [Deltaproteobacteria bacterium]
MTDRGLQAKNKILLDPSGRIILPEAVMDEIVIETPGCQLWYNEKTSSLGVKLLRGEESPPIKIERQPGTGDIVKGIIETGAFLRQVGFELFPDTRSLSFRYFEKYHLLEIQLREHAKLPEIKEKGFLDDYPGIED